MSVVPIAIARIERPWHSWGRSLFAVTVVFVLLVLGVANITMRTRWHEVEDGVLWGQRAEGVTAIEVAAGSPGERAGLQPGDVLVAVNGRSGRDRVGCDRIPARW